MRVLVYVPGTCGKTENAHNVHQLHYSRASQYFHRRKNYLMEQYTTWIMAIDKRLIHTSCKIVPKLSHFTSMIHYWSVSRNFNINDMILQFNIYSTNTCAASTCRIIRIRSPVEKFPQRMLPILSIELVDTQTISDSFNLILQFKNDILQLYIGPPINKW